MQGLLLYNPVAGRDRLRRTQCLPKLLSALAESGFSLSAQATYCRGSGHAQAAEAVQRGAQVVFAYGGDGTVHDVLQGTAGSEAMLGILPAGSANALAREVHIADDPTKAARSYRPGAWTVFRTTRVERQEQPTLVTLCMAGAGADGLLMYRMLAVDRFRFGRWRYYEHALRVFMTHKFASFRVFVRGANGNSSEHVCVCAMALRVGALGGLFSGIARGVSLADPDLTVILVAPPARLVLPLWFVLSWLGIRRCPGLSRIRGRSIQMQDAVPLQVSGEWAGRYSATFDADGPFQRVLVPLEQSQ